MACISQTCNSRNPQPEHSPTQKPENYELLTNYKIRMKRSYYRFVIK